MAVNTQLLKQDGRPLWLVARLDGQLTQFDEPVIRAQLLKQVQQWQTAGLNVIGIEIDHDAASAQLAHYQQFMQQLRQQLPASLQLSITVLPTWLSSPDLPKLLQQADSSVLQVHAILPAEQGLFEPTLALDWIKRYVAITARPFLVALPAYGIALIGFDSQRARVESEVSLRVAGNLQELTVAPQQMVDFLHQLAQQKSPYLQGIIWFRLPLRSDRRAWSLSTLNAVILNQSLTPHWQVIIQPDEGEDNQAGQLYDVILHNDGLIDALLPKQVTINASDCLAADASEHYRLESYTQQQRFIRVSDETLRAGRQRPLGWIRCTHLIKGSSIVTQ